MPNTETKRVDGGVRGIKKFAMPDSTLGKQVAVGFDRTVPITPAQDSTRLYISPEVWHMGQRKTKKLKSEARGYWEEDGTVKEKKVHSDIQVA